MPDNKDREILGLLQVNSRTTASEVAVVVGLSVPAVAERIRKLTEAGYIRSFTVLLDHKRLGLDLTAFILVVSSSSDHYEDVVKCADAEPAVMECHSITGEGSHLLKVRVANSSALEQLLREIQLWPGVARTHTMVVLSTYKESTQLALDRGQQR